ncbi:hypothetical protein L1885_25635, partial [Streptomyces fuscigenes]|nr:hypothetical protein [Streptomyces fuscigenes]
MSFTVPGPRGRRSYDSAHPGARERIARFHEEAFGRSVLRAGPDGAPRLATGVAFDVLELPARAGRAVVERLDRLVRSARPHGLDPAVPAGGGPGGGG